MNYTEGYVRKNHVTSEKGVSMDRVIIPGEAPGSATYYMGFAPEEYGATGEIQMFFTFAECISGSFLIGEK